MKSKRGFASMTPEKLKEITSKGGSAKVRKGFATMTPEQRAEFGRKGGLKSKKVGHEEAKNT